MSEWLTKANAELLGWVLGTLVAAFLGKSWMTRRVSKDGVVVATNAGEISLNEKLQSEINRRREEQLADYARWAQREKELIERADRINEERNRLIEQIRALRQQVHDLSARVLELSGHVEKVERIAEAHKEVAEGLRKQLEAFMKIHVVGGDKGGQA